MSDDAKLPPPDETVTTGETTSTAHVTRKRHRVLRGFAWVGLVLVGLVAVLALVATWYTGTADFQRRVGGEVVSTLENATGGRVELRYISFNLWHLAVEADGLVIHGTEAPGEMPYLSASKIFLRLHLNMILTHVRGLGPQSRISLRYLRVEQPHFHLIMDKNGHSNAPVPKHRSTSNKSVEDTLLDLRARKVELVDGLAVVNDKAVPFNVAAKDVSAEAHYERKADHYGITIDLADLRTKLANEKEVQSKMHLTAELGRDMFALKSLDFSTTPDGGLLTHLTADALVQHFASPEWQASVTGNVDVKQLGYLTDVEGLKGGTLDLKVNGHSCSVTPQVAQKNPHFWQGHKHLPPSAKVLPPDPNCAAGYLLVGSMKMHDIAYRDENVRLQGINGGADLHITPTELLFTALSGYLPGGGDAKGQLKIENWLGEASPDSAASSPTTVAAATTVNSGAKSIGAKAPITSLKSAPVQSAHAYLTVVVERIPLRTIMDATATPGYGDLGFDTSITGPTTVEWGGPEKDISDTVQVQAHLTFAPTGVRRKGALSNVPVSGEVVGHYDGRIEVVNIAQLTLRSPSATLTTNGVLGVNVGDPLTNLQVNLQTRDLGEFDQLLQTLAFEGNGRKGAAAIPVVLHGNANFVGTAKGAIRNMEVKGHLTANDLVLQASEFGEDVPDVHIDSLVTNADYSPNGGVTVVSSTIERGTAVLNLVGTVKPHHEILHGAGTYAWDKEMEIDASAKLANGQATDVLQIAGMQAKVPVTGTVNLDLSGSGTIHNIIGGGMVTLTNGVAYGENYQKIAVDIAAEGQQVSLTKVLLEAHGLSITGSAGYNLGTKLIRAQASGNNLQLSKFDTIRKAEPDADGVLSFTAIANGTLQEPDLHARLTLEKISVQGKPLGGLEAKADSAGSNLNYELQSKLVGAQLNGSGETSLLGDYETKAKLTISGLDIANVITLMAPGSFKGSSAIAGTINVSGPAATPKVMVGSAEFNELDLKLQGVELKAAEPARASLRNGTVTLDQIHVIGQDTDLLVYGTAVVFGDPNPLGGRMAVHANGSISMALAKTFNPDLISSGKVTFNVAAGGRMKKPTFTGDVRFQNVNLSIEGIANGLSNLNGTLVFNEDRLEVQTMTAMTGGGQLKIGGYLAYQKGLFADLTATGDVVRVRYNGLSATANASFRLQGQPQSMLLSGNILVTRFGVGADVDFAALSAAGGVQAPPDPDSALNKIRLDVHITSSPQLDFQNSYAKLAGSVNLTVRGTLAQPSVLGRIQITDGSATYLGTKYELQRGTIYFSNPVRIDPTIDLDATARVENYDLTIGVHGTVTNLKPTYRSEPPLTEADIFNLLALGRTQEEAQLYQEQQSQIGADPTTSALLGGALNATVASRVGKLFGAGSVKIDPAFIGTLGNSSARITVSEPLSKQLTLVFATNVNETAQQLIQVQYQLNQQYSIVATRDESGVFSFVFKIRKRYK
ncbi:translocation/assembly module TamB domain-containing protein [Granulicella sp. L46]|uniref:translocation/assembly module TamB domain-containing protein n=1 Tax=Granulicella sp. L46 TaxID=1641865 RepID=UPI00131EAFB9|nr:translocation/assembly module TamB domain-containing protein [Granulicella sp. L46]